MGSILPVAARVVDPVNITGINDYFDQSPGGTSQPDMVPSFWSHGFNKLRSDINSAAQGAHQPAIKPHFAPMGPAAAPPPPPAAHWGYTAGQGPTWQTPQANGSGGYNWDSSKPGEWNGGGNRI